MKKLSLLTIILLCFSASVYSQTAGISLMLGSPQGEFRKNVDRLGYGLQIQGTLWSPSKERPFTIGLNLGFMVYGEVSESRPLSETIPDVYVDVDRTNSIANLHFLMLVSPFTGTVRPYLEGLVGGSYLSTTTDVKSEYTQDSFAESTNYDDFNWSYGWGGGIIFQVAKDLGDVKNLYVDLKARYLYGTEAEYLTENDVVIENGRAYYYPRLSKTDLLTFHIGVIAYF
jgi:hypothetical protein